MPVLNKDLVKALGMFQVVLADALGPPLLLGGLGYFFYRKYHLPVGGVIFLASLGALIGFWRLYHIALRMTESNEKN